MLVSMAGMLVVPCVVGAAGSAAVVGRTGDSESCVVGGGFNCTRFAAICWNAAISSAICACSARS